MAARAVPLAQGRAPKQADGAVPEERELIERRIEVGLPVVAVHDERVAVERLELWVLSLSDEL